MQVDKDPMEKRTRATADCDLSEGYRSKYCLIYNLDEAIDDTLEESNNEVEKEKSLENETEDKEINEKLAKYVVIEVTQTYLVIVTNY